jgi:hypothetical protein
MRSDVGRGAAGVQSACGPNQTGACTTIACTVKQYNKAAAEEIAAHANCGVRGIVWWKPKTANCSRLGTAQAITIDEVLRILAQSGILQEGEEAGSECLAGAKVVQCCKGLHEAQDLPGRQGIVMVRRWCRYIPFYLCECQRRHKVVLSRCGHWWWT